MNNLIFVWIGNELPDWAVISLNISVRNSNCTVFLLTSNICNAVDPACNQVLISSFYVKSDSRFVNNNVDFRDGFWVKTTERFFILRDFILKNQIKSFFHAEIDNLIFDISNLESVMNKIGIGLFIPKDSVERCIASLIYINKPSLLCEFCEYVINNPNLLSNDMYLLGDFGNRKSDVFYLPNESIFSEKSDFICVDHVKLKGIFDAASIGQYLFGIDPRNSRLPVFNKFINENCKSDLASCKFKISIKENKATINGINLYNIHVHSKIFAKLSNDNWIDRVVNRINLNKKSFISFEIFN